ncbi:ABC transporter permease [Sphingomonas sp. ID0503]|uniref:ABC transporter permease n=1 Tax=Sphingomonas sp. ID0503 TaxID=3399691 RepID=UPI003AFB44A5
MAAMGLNVPAMRVLYLSELERTWRTLFQSILTPVLTTSLYFIVFGSAIGSRMQTVDGISYGAFIVPGLMLLTVLSESIGNASIGIYLPRFTGTVYETLSAPIGVPEILVGYVGAAATKSAILALIILATARLFVPFHIVHPVWALAFLILIAVSFCLLGFILGLWADGFERLQIVPMMVVTPLTFLGGTFYSISMLPEPWRTVTLFNPVVYLVNGFRWCFYGTSDVDIRICVALTLAFMGVCIAIIAWIFRTGYRLRG